ncbi:hypothetical protein [Asaia prunellae]|uniref:hypothetical protein n=1 Tax=Asaia prunellae TaxID=610245 RepID=UPI0011DE59AD|nr:hypothetical protein [Asaia prunellae]
MSKILPFLLKPQFAIFCLAVLAPASAQAQPAPNTGPVPVRATLGQILDLVYSWKRPEEINLARLYETESVPSCTDRRCSMRGLATSDGYKIDSIEIIVLKPGLIDRIILYLPKIDTCATLSVAMRRFNLRFQESELHLADLGGQGAYLSYERKRGSVAFFATGGWVSEPSSIGRLTDTCMTVFGTGTLD